ncbi:MAG: type II toxin-antitoxin system toxin DNA ADP-ribosyl transferase DarT [Bryobacteraceae bacterium]
MALALTRENGLIFRITHRDNVPWILDNGMHARNGERFDPACRNIGNVDLIDKRSRRAVPVEPGGTLSDYVPFYFTPFSIMMFNIKTGYGVKHVPNDEIVIFVSSLPHIAAQGIPFVFTNQHAYPPMADYFTDHAELDRIDWPLLQSRNFKHDPDDPGKKERYQAEALIWKHVPLEALQGVCCYTSTVKQQIGNEIESRGLSFKVAVQQSWYFS